ncbi:MAG: MFS transporter [Thermoprotei archaeon]
MASFRVGWDRALSSSCPGERRKVKESRWSLSPAQYSILLSTSSSMFLWGIIASIGPLAASGKLVSALSPILKVTVLLVGPLFLLIGNLAVGVMSDRIGRKKMFMVTMLAYGIGLLLVVISTYFFSFPGLIMGLALSEFGIGGEEPPSLSLLTENFSTDSRAFFITFSTNFANAGAAFISGLLLIIPSAYTSFAMLGTATAILLILVVVRFSVPESFRWLKEKGRFDEAKKELSRLKIPEEGLNIRHPGYVVPLIALILMGISQYLTYGLMSFVIGPYEFPSTSFDEEIILFSNLGATVGGIIAAYLINAFSRKFFAMWTFIGGLLTTAVIGLLSYKLSDPLVFFPLLFINMVMSEFAWAARVTLEPESFPTRFRGTAVGIIRIFPIAAYEASIYFTSGLNLTQYIAYNFVLWCIGVVGAGLWAKKGFETKGVSPDYLV